jgi:butyryl-CoA dehydrogenase
MDISLSPAQHEIGRRFAELVDDELVPEIRRMSERPVPAEAADAEQSAVARAAVWGALVDLGATRLLLPAQYDGEQAGQQGAVVLAELLGRAAYQGPLLDTMAAAEILLAAGGEAVGGAGHGKLLTEIAEGAAVPLAPRSSGRDDLAHPGPFTRSAAVTGPGAADAIEARRAFVAFGAEGRYLMVVGRPQPLRDHGDGHTGDAPLCAALVPRDHPSVSLRRQEDVSRGELYSVHCAGTPVLSWAAGPERGLHAWPAIIARARIRHAAYLVGLSQGALDLAVSRADARRQFGRPIGRFQALAFRLAELSTRLEGVRWLTRAAAWEADEDGDARLSAAQALAAAADLTGDVTLAAMQLHGAYGMTEESDIQIYYRRASVDRVWLGAAAQLRREALPLLAESVRRKHPEAYGAHRHQKKNERL